MRILMVCLGNICRSPIADGLLRHKVKLQKLDVIVDSAGTAGFHIGAAPDARMCATAKNRGISIDDLQARQFETADFDRFNIIYAMDESNQSDILKMARDDRDRAKVRLILNEIYPGENKSVPDPYYGGDQGFEDVYDMLDAATTKIINDLNT